MYKGVSFPPYFQPSFPHSAILVEPLCPHGGKHTEEQCEGVLEHGSGELRGESSSVPGEGFLEEVEVELSLEGGCFLLP